MKAEKWAPAIMVGLLAAVAHGAGYTGIVLYKLTPPSGISDFTLAGTPQTAAGGFVVAEGEDTSGNEHGLLFLPGQATGIDLGIGTAAATNGAFATGNGGADLATTVWNTSGAVVGTYTVPGSVSDSAASPYGLSGSLPFGAAEFFHATGATIDAGYWTGASSFVDLGQPAFSSSVMWNTDGTQQVGWGIRANTAFPHAVIWSGSADSVVDLNPAGYTDSYATAVANGYQVGYGTATGQFQALLWQGSADSVLNLTPQGYTSAQAYGVNATTEVGVGTTSTSATALLWTGTANSAVNLGTLLPTNLEGSTAYTIDSLGDVYGTAGDGTNEYAVEWTPTAPLPGDANMDGIIGSADLAALTDGQQNHLTGWSHGDFNQDGVINADDWAIFQLGLAEQSPNNSATPEPSFFAFLSLIIFPISRRRAAN